MLQKALIILLLNQFFLKTSFVLTQELRGDEYYNNQDEGADDGIEGMEMLKAVYEVEDQASEIQPANYHMPIKGKHNPKSPTWNFKHFRAKKEVRGFDLTEDEMVKFKIWKDGVIPYYIDVVSFGDKVLRDKIRNFLQMVNSATGINFVELAKPPPDNKERWVFFINRRGLLGCADHNVNNFSNHGVQQVVLGYDCMSTKGELAEAVMAIVGIPPEHNSPDRDEYIKIRMDNIMPDKKHLFEKLGDRDWLFHDLPYDFNSVTHYDLHKYSANGHATIVPTHHYDDFKPATKFSPSDIRKIKMLYSYITKKNKIQAPVCEKLFEIGKIDKRDKKRIKPRHKPSRYLGIPKPENEESSDQSSDSKQYSDDSNERKKDNYRIEKNNDDYNHRNEILSDGPDNNSNKQDDTQNEEKRSGKTDKKLLKYKRKKRKKAVFNSLLQLSDYDSSQDNKRVPLKAPLVMDALTLLSDYQTDGR